MAAVIARNAHVRKRYVSVVAEVEAEIDEEALEEAGWHSEDGCPNKPSAALAPAPDLRDALASLHRQAHPSQAADPYLCREEPCRSLSLDQLVPVMGRQR